MGSIVDRWPLAVGRLLIVTYFKVGQRPSINGQRFQTHHLMIKTKYLLAAIVVLVVSSYQKRWQQAAYHQLKSMSSNIIPVQDGLQLIFDFNENNSVIDSFGVIKIRTNQLQVATLRDTLYYNVPTYPKTLKGQLQIDMTNTDLISAISPPTSGNPPVNESDSLILRFFAKDQANHTSDTITTGQVIVLR